MINTTLVMDGAEWIAAAWNRGLLLANGGHNYTDYKVMGYITPTKNGLRQKKRLQCWQSTSTSPVWITSAWSSSLILKQKFWWMTCFLISECEALSISIKHKITCCSYQKLFKISQLPSQDKCTLAHIRIAVTVQSVDSIHTGRHGCHGHSSVPQTIPYYVCSMSKNNHTVNAIMPYTCTWSEQLFAK